MNDFQIQAAAAADAREISALIKLAFDRFIAPDYALEGVLTFNHFTHPESLSRRLQTPENYGFVALIGNAPVGYIETRAPGHITLFFTHPDWSRRGIGRKLFEHAVADLRLRHPTHTRLTVNASPYAEPIYRSFGFSPETDWQIKDGIRYLPMAMNLL